MAKFTWQDGTLVSKAKVEIDGTIYEVDPEEYSGATPLSASNLNSMQDGIYEDIGDLSDLETSDKTSVVNAINSRTLKKLWENPNPTANFSAQNITLSSADYDYLKWFYKKSRNESGLMSTETLKGYDVTLNGSGSAHVSGSSNYVGSAYTRNCTRVSDTEYSIPNSTVNVGNSTNAGSDTTFYLIPIAVYGGKF